MQSIARRTTLCRRRLAALSTGGYLFYVATCPGAQQAAVGASMTSLPLAILVFRTDGQRVVDRTRIRASLEVVSWTQAFEAEVAPCEYRGRAELSVRGNSSYYYPKKSYRLELQDEDGKDAKAPL